jgi:hypothetical protein
MTLTKVVGGVIADGTIASVDITDSTITNAKMALSPANASNLSSGDVPSAQLDNIPTEGLEADIALLAFKTQANGNLARYNLVDQSVDAFEDASGVDASTSTGETRNSAGKYYSGSASATGGTITSYSSGGTDYTVHTFSANGDFIPGSAGNLDAILVAGGGGGGSQHHGAGGGGGGVIIQSGYSATVQTYGIVVGAGATAVNAALKGEDGNNSTGFGMTAFGGGGGGASGSVAGRSGGSGGGGGASNGAAGATTQTSNGGGTGHGFAGGAQASSYGGAGGGGAGAVGVGNGGQGGGGSAGGVGGIGVVNLYQTGVNQTYGGGGGGCSYSTTPTYIAAGGVGGGGAGEKYNTGNAVDGTDGLGGGGGGNGGYNTTQGTAGGDGIAIIRYVTGALDSYSNMTLVSNSITAQTAPTKGDLVFTYTNGAGTAVLGTNITAEYSADNGSTWTNFSISASDTQGTTGGHTIVTKNNVTLTTTSGTSMRYRIKTLVQSVSLQTRIHAVSLGWS